MLTHKGTQTIETQRLILRRFRMEDAQEVFCNWESDDEVTKYLTWPSHSSIEITKMVLNDWIASYDKNDFYLWAITVKSEGNAPIGSISVVDQDDRIEKAEIGYCIGKNWWHRGIMTEALGAVIQYLFDEVGMNRIAACHDPRNPHSGAVMRKCGMTYEGTFRQSGLNNQGVCDASYYAILRGER